MQPTQATKTPNPATTATATHASKTPALDKLIHADPDLVDRIFDYILAEFPAISEQVSKYKADVRKEFAGEECYIAGKPATARQEQVSQVLALFNGRNATEVARRLQIGRATVYRLLKQSGRAKPSHFSGK